MQTKLYEVQYRRSNRWDVYPQAEPVQSKRVEAYSEDDASDRVANIRGIQSIEIVRVVEVSR